jgi:septum formation protein
VSGSPLILASTSPRRNELLALLHVPFVVVNPTFVEHSTVHQPSMQAVHHADGKATAASKAYPNALVLACDTLIDLDGQVLGKPDSEADARAMLKRLQGRDHLVHSAVALRRACDGVKQNGIETVRVRMRTLSDLDLDRYVQSREWSDKAGAYAIQGAGGAFIQAIQGDYTAVVGLPLRLVASLLTSHLMLPVDVETVYRERPYGNWSRFSSS